jgi:RNA polymerase sigma-70 factor, ECF subfamily
LNVADQQLDERQLIEAAQRDPRRFAELYERYFDRVYGYVARRVGQRHEAEDITADVFHRALEMLPRFEWRGIPFIVWLLRIAANSIADHWRGPRAANSGALPESAAATIGERDLAGAERRALLAQLVAALPEIQRRVILGRFVYEKSTAELAAEIQRTEGAVKQLQFRAIHSLRASLQSPARREESHG